MSAGSPTIIHCPSVRQTLEAGAGLGRRLCAEYPQGIVVLLIGPLGAGKTVFAKGVAEGLGIPDQIVSPTYTIVSEYTSGRMLLHHIDLYRIEGIDQMENLGLEDIFRGTGVVLVEWGEKIESALAPALPYLRVTVAIDAEDARTITVDEVRA